MNKRYLFLILLFLLGCTPKHKSKYQKIEDFVIHHSSNKSLADYSTLVIINAKEIKCIACDNAFSVFMSKKVQNPKVLFIVSDDGATIDISGFLDQKRPNIILDRHEEFAKLNIVNGCSILHLNNHKIVDSIEVNYKTIDGILRMDKLSRGEL